MTSRPIGWRPGDPLPETIAKRAAKERRIRGRRPCYGRKNGVVDGRAGRIREHIAEHGPTTTEDLVDALQLTVVEVQHALSQGNFDRVETRWHIVAEDRI